MKGKWVRESNRKSFSFLNQSFNAQCCCCLTWKIYNTLKNVRFNKSNTASQSSVSIKSYEISGFVWFSSPEIANDAISSTSFGRIPCGKCKNWISFFVSENEKKSLPKQWKFFATQILISRLCHKMKMFTYHDETLGSIAWTFIWFFQVKLILNSHRARFNNGKYDKTNFTQNLTIQANCRQMIRQKLISNEQKRGFFVFLLLLLWTERKNR